MVVHLAAAAITTGDNDAEAFLRMMYSVVPGGKKEAQGHMCNGGTRPRAQLKLNGNCK